MAPADAESESDKRSSQRSGINKKRHRGGNHDGVDVNQKKPLKPIYPGIISSLVDRCKIERRR